jgi:cytochrome c-type biogenesis protein CcmH
VDYELLASPAQATPSDDPPAAAAGPSEDEMAAAAELDPAEREEMIRGMVEGLASRLASEGGPAADWARLVTSLAVLGDTERAQAILAEARTVFEGDAEAQGLLDEAVRASGLPE